MWSCSLSYDIPNWNEYIRAERTNKYLANNIKQKEKRLIQSMCKSKYNGEYPISITFKVHFGNKRKDLDNTRVKGIIDGLVSAGVIKNDNLNCIQRIVLEPIFDDTSGIDVIIEEHKKTSQP